eukprot:CAMPEP_0179224634 /NCGR_PEP_ID=MMETSP0797-20121207/7889_1 /TAXON_ID=47934 /ORGANISM="Dinophysis acuminata, Strain DAEP01" /LENGTH=331 /DNA_ID=CAMNT_0020931617 /DNA_START=68 /DNA_END=1059 /DNA_ORIENTATION=+
MNAGGSPTSQDADEPASPSSQQTSAVPILHWQSASPTSQQMSAVPSLYWQSPRPEIESGIYAAAFGVDKLGGFGPDFHQSWTPGFLSMFPAAFSLFCAVLFLVPISSAFHLSQDRNVQYWIGDWGDCTILLPVLFLIAFYIHTRLRVPNWSIILVCLFVPAVVLLIFGDVVASMASDQAEQLFSTDCDTSDGKRSLENSWKEASILYSECLRETRAVLLAHGENLTVEAALAKFRFQDCSEYHEKAPQHKRHWDYLWYLEEEQRCSGWCAHGRPLWTYKQVEDSCSVAVSQVFSKKVERAAKQIVTYTLGILVFVILLLIPEGGIRCISDL